jgi:hypothetical protein
MRLGMALREVDMEHEDLKRERNPFRIDGRSKGWFVWVESRTRGLLNYVLPESDDPGARIVAVMTVLDLSEANLSTAIEALAERWGEPSFRNEPSTEVRYYSELGAPRGEFGWRATIWQDPDCDVVATLLATVTATTMPPARPVEQVLLSLDSLSTVAAAHERNLEAAREAVRP